MSIRADVQRPAPGAKVELYTLDCSAIGGGVYRFSSSVGDQGPLRWDGQEYSPVPIVLEGCEITTKGFPSPTLTMGSQLYSIIAANLRLQDLIGAKVTRVRTFAHYLDDGATPDTSQTLPLDIFVVRRRASLDFERITWELRVASDIENVTLPRRRASANYCAARYRWWNTALNQFVYEGECPWAGAAMYTVDNLPTSDPLLDICSKSLTGCSIRFGAEPLPSWSFPGARD
jgi:lambda family phage minor tail protein L